MQQFSASSWGWGRLDVGGFVGGLIPTAGLKRVLPAVPGSQVIASLRGTLRQRHVSFVILPSDASF